MKPMLPYNLTKKTSTAVKRDQNSSSRFYPHMRRVDNLSRRKNDGSSELYTRACYRYRKNENGNLEIYEPEAEIVGMVFDIYLSGTSVHMIRKQLVAEGVKTAKGKDTWSKLAIEKLLTNEKYIGDVRIAKPQGKRRGTIDVSGGYLHTDAHPAIIQRDVFAAVQAERKKRSNVVIDETGVHRKATRYSEMRDSNAEEWWAKIRLQK